MGSKRYSKPRLRKQVSSICIECEARTLTQLNTSITTQLLFIFSVALYSISCERSEGLPMTTACFSVALCVVVGSLEDERYSVPSQIRHGLTRPLRSAEGKRRGREERDRGAETGRSCQIGVGRDRNGSFDQEGRQARRGSQLGGFINHQRTQSRRSWNVLCQRPQSQSPTHSQLSQTQPLTQPDPTVGGGPVRVRPALPNPTGSCGTNLRTGGSTVFCPSRYPEQGTHCLAGI